VVADPNDGLTAATGVNGVEALRRGAPAVGLDLVRPSDDTSERNADVPVQA